MIRRRLGLAGAAALTAASAGCVTVHGERENVPSVRTADAAKALAHFADLDNQAARTYDQSVIGRIESGPLEAIDTASVRSAHAQHPAGNPSLTPLAFSDTRYLIPRQVGWPKFFVADSATNRDADSRWVLLFRRASAAGPWTAQYLAVVPKGGMPQLATDQGGHVLAVPAKETSLLVPPADLSAAYAGYLQTGEGADRFAPGAATTQVRDDRSQQTRTANSVTQYADQADTAGDFAPAALRTKDGGAIVFFATRHQSRSTFRAGYKLNLDAGTQALMTGDPKTSVTLSRVGQELARVPRAGTGAAAGSGAGSPDDGAGDGGGRIVFLSRLLGLVGAKGE